MKEFIARNSRWWNSIRAAGNFFNFFVFIFLLINLRDVLRDVVYVGNPRFNIPLYKNDNPELFKNYRPIPILPCF